MKHDESYEQKVRESLVGKIVQKIFLYVLCFGGKIDLFEADIEFEFADGSHIKCSYSDINGYIVVEDIQRWSRSFEVQSSVPWSDTLEIGLPLKLELPFLSLRREIYSSAISDICIRVDETNATSLDISIGSAKVTISHSASLSTKLAFEVASI
jgi:hypothetical protein